MRPCRKGRRRSREPRENGKSDARRSGGVARSERPLDVPPDQPVCLAHDDELAIRHGPEAEFQC